jgi:hypothetical protein
MPDEKKFLVKNKLKKINLRMIFTSGLYQNWAQPWFHLAWALIPVKLTALGVFPTLGML